MVALSPLTNLLRGFKLPLSTLFLHFFILFCVVVPPSVLLSSGGLSTLILLYTYTCIQTPLISSPARILQHKKKFKGKWKKNYNNKKKAKRDISNRDVMQTVMMQMADDRTDVIADTIAMGNC